MKEMFKVVVCGREFGCESAGCEYEYDGMEKPYLPFKPFRCERIIDDEYAYLVDAKGIVWIYSDIGYYDENHVLEEYGRNFFRPCLREGLNYVMTHEPALMKLTPSEVLEIIGVNDPRGPIYDAEWQEAI